MCCAGLPSPRAETVLTRVAPTYPRQMLPLGTSSVVPYSNFLSRTNVSSRMFFLLTYTCPLLQSEDDGVVLSSLVWGQGLEQQVGLLVLDAASWHELGRTVFKTPSPVPKCLHGWFTADF